METGKSSVTKVKTRKASVMKVEIHAARKKKLWERTTRSATAGGRVEIWCTEGGVSGNVRKDMSSIEKVKEDGRG